MTYEFSKLEKKEHLWIVTLNRPERMNALHSPAHKELHDIFNDFHSDNEAWVAIVTGEGDRAFSAGNDLRYQAEGGKMENVEDRKRLPVVTLAGRVSTKCRKF